MRNEVVVQKMIAYIDKIQMYVGDCGYAAFCDNPQLSDACVFNLSQIGELAGKLDAEFTQAFPAVPWRQMRGLRNRIVHDYEGVNLLLVWEIIDEDLPQLKRALQGIL